MKSATPLDLIFFISLLVFVNSASPSLSTTMASATASSKDLSSVASTPTPLTKNSDKMESLRPTDTSTNAIDPQPNNNGAVEDTNDAGLEKKLDVAAERDEEEDIEYPHGLKLAVILSALCLAVFLVALDQTIISTAIPKM